ncbi:MAG TPA: hypothetical protein DDW93_12105 [Firmicutes bacterium]|jgi:hypothetical protein|nr:hypothetical protein [Bacillota bacterium]HBK69754.1 hypothetical protein [Bacillota bacterium]
MRKTMVVLVTLVMLFSIVPVAMGGFEDAPKASHWAYDNFTLLYNAGLLKGYPDGTFKGERYATRYEMVELTARILKYLESRIDETDGISLPENGGRIALDEAQAKELIRQALLEADPISRTEFAAQKDEQVNEIYDALEALEDEFKAELAKRGDVNISLLESKVAALEQKVEEQDAKIETVAKDTKKVKTLSIVGLILGVAGIVFGFVPAK